MTQNNIFAYLHFLNIFQLTFHCFRSMSNIFEIIIDSCYITIRCEVSSSFTVNQQSPWLVFVGWVRVSSVSLIRHIGDNLPHISWWIRSVLMLKNFFFTSLLPRVTEIYIFICFTIQIFILIIVILLAHDDTCWIRFQLRIDLRTAHRNLQ